MGVRTIAVYSDADVDAVHVRAADEAHHIGPSPAQESYLNVAAVLAVAKRSGAAAIHPGYGFLSENADFAEAVANAGLIFVGPTPEAIRQMGSKIEAKRIVSAAGTPVVPGYHGADQSDAALAAAAEEVGFPLLIKASAGGGGKGMRLVESIDEFDAALAGARREAKASFDDDSVLLERYLTAPKHIEIQLLADHHGHIVHLLERDCSVQRRHQKVVEEAPAPGIMPATRAAMGAAAVAAASAIDYRGAGTVEFICEGDDFFFMEMNTRLQVEHPVTEAITGVDLVEWQLRIAAGERLTLDQDAIQPSGHAVEVRIYAENPKKSFLPSTGLLHLVEFGADARIDTGVVTGSEVTPFYDPMLAKVICHGEDRRAALKQLDTALAQTNILGVEHNVAYLRRVLGYPDFVKGDHTTRLVDNAGKAIVPDDSPMHAACAALSALFARGSDGIAPWDAVDGFRLNQARQVRYDLVAQRKPVATLLEFFDAHVSVTVRGATLRVEAWEHDGDRFSCRVDGTFVAGVSACFDRDWGEWFVSIDGAVERFRRKETDLGNRASAGGGAEKVVSPMPGQVTSVLVEVGQTVAENEPLVVVEAMKMEHTLRAPKRGKVAAVCFAPGDRVDDGAELIKLES